MTEDIANGGRSGVTLTWEEVRYMLKTKVGPRCDKHEELTHILRGISGIAKPGQLLAIMGSTGAGKTTLFDILANRKTNDRSHIVSYKSILINGQPRDDKLFKRIAGYVMQDDALIGSLTVRETLTFYADLKLPRTISAERKAERVTAIIDELGLTRVADSMIGTQFVRGISGGEKKRVSIGCELITDPPLLFCDEPTTGLDSFNALAVMQTLQALAHRHNHTVICTIHQPSAAIYQLFDAIMILSKGEVAYLGPAGNAAVEYFSEIGHPCPQFMNPTEHFIEVAVRSEQCEQRAVDGVDIENGRATDPTAASIPLVEASTPSLSERYSQSVVWKQTSQEISEISQKAKAAGVTGAEEQLSEYATPWWYQIGKLSARTWTTLRRDPMVTRIQLVQTIFLALLVGSVYWQIGDGQSSIQDRQGVFLFILANQAFSMMTSLTAFLTERGIFNRERASGCYRTSSYFISRNIIEFPMMMMFPLVFASICYWMVGFQSDGDKFGTFLGTLVLFTGTSHSIFLLIGSAAPTFEAAQVMAPLITVLTMLFGSGMITQDSIPVYYKWLAYLSYFRYAYEIIAYNEFDGLKFDCTSEERADTGGVCPISNGDGALRLFDLEDTVVWHDVLILLSMVIGYRILAYLCLRFMHSEKR